MINYWTIFTTGLLTGGLTCLAVQGGLLAATLANQQENELIEGAQKTQSVFPVISFLIAKLVAYTVLGLLLGWFGSLFQLSLGTQVIMQIAVVVFMLGTAMNILNVHPIFRYFVIQPPRFLSKRVRAVSRNSSMFAPALMGAMTVFIPCGTTQAMMALAIGSGDPLSGALILFAFVLGTTPLFFILGFYASRLNERVHDVFMKVAALTLIVMALFNGRNALALAGVKVGSSMSESTGESAPVLTDATITFLQTSYSPERIAVRAGSEVSLNLVNDTGSGCIQAFTIPSLDIQQIVPVGSREVVTFTAPSKPQQIEFMCSMGMYRGVIDVI